jgi:hypothetical protein
MRHSLSLLAAITILAAPASAQTMKVLAYNTNGQILAATNVTWTNPFSFSTNTVAAQVRTNLGLAWSALTNTNSATHLLGVTVNAGQAILVSPYSSIEITNTEIVGGIIGAYNFVVTDVGSITFEDASASARTRTNLGLPLAALTNTSNVTAMRALSGSTNTNTPYSGSVSLTNTNTLVFSNGILQSVQ